MLFALAPFATSTNPRASLVCTHMLTQTLTQTNTQTNTNNHSQTCREAAALRAEARDVIEAMRWDLEDWAAEVAAIGCPVDVAAVAKAEASAAAARGVLPGSMAEAFGVASVVGEATTKEKTSEHNGKAATEAESLVDAQRYVYDEELEAKLWGRQKASSGRNGSASASSSSSSSSSSLSGKKRGITEVGGSTPMQPISEGTSSVTGTEMVALFSTPSSSNHPLQSGGAGGSGGGGGAGGAAGGAGNVPEDKIEQLTCMGFPRDKCITALRRANMDVGSAVAFLL